MSCRAAPRKIYNSLSSRPDFPLYPVPILRHTPNVGCPTSNSAMSSGNQEYSVDQEIVNFFNKSSATRSACDERAKELVGGNSTPVAVQGACSYSVYAGPSDNFVVQFRLRSLQLKTETSRLARETYGPLAPRVSFEGQVGEDIDMKEPLYTYVMSRIRGISHLDFILAHDLPQNSPENFAWRKTLIADVARYARLTLLSLNAHWYRAGSLYRHGRPHRLSIKPIARTFVIDSRLNCGSCSPLYQTASTR